MRSLSLLGTTLAYWEGNRVEVTVAVAPPDPAVPGGPHGEASPSPAEQVALAAISRPPLLLARGLWFQSHTNPFSPQWPLHTSSVWPSGSSM